MFFSSQVNLFHQNTKRDNKNTMTIQCIYWQGSQRFYQAQNLQPVNTNRTIDLSVDKSCSIYNCTYMQCLSFKGGILRLCVWCLKNKVDWINRMCNQNNIPDIKKEWTHDLWGAKCLIQSQRHQLNHLTSSWFSHII